MKILEGQKIVVFGGAGFIGSELVHQLVALGADVIVVDNLVNGKRENLEGLPANQCKLTVADIRDRDKMSETLQGAHAAFHLACLGVRHSIHSPMENHEVNATGTLNLLMCAREADVDRFVYVSSSEVYGTGRWVPMNEDHPTTPPTVYGAAKLAGECYARAYHDTYGYPTVVVRPFNTYGPRSHHEGDCGEVIPKFLLRALAGKPMIVFGDGRQTRDFTYVSDTARGIIEVGLADFAVGQTINLGYGTEISINELANEVRKAVGNPDAHVKHTQGRPGDNLRLWADTTKARKEIRFEPKISLLEGLRLLMAWYESLGVSPDELLAAEQVHNWEGSNNA
jgi:UDP-glucose 4-epimerase